MKTFLLFAVILGIIASVLGDCYMQYPPGSNDRNQEANTDRNNANRLFDSQNNAQGGYCRGPAMQYYEGSLMTVMWTNQHGCGGNPNLVCNLVMQYLCGDASDTDLNTLIRDGSGTTTNTIPTDGTGATQTDANGEPLYGLHENFAYYQTCNARERNMGLFIADRASQGGLTPNRYSAMFTRQNNNGDQYGLECTEERDYYPYWAPTPWKDVAVFPSSTKYCNFYRSQSENVKGREYCEDTNGDGKVGNNPTDCAGGGDTWTKSSSHSLSAPDCIQLPMNQDNHLGNNVEGTFNTYQWVIPDASKACGASTCNCVLRIRYNISTGDVGSNGNNPDSGFIDYRSNGNLSPIQDDSTNSQDGNPLTLALDTTQYGRTFQDRSHVFNIMKRPASLGGKIWNLNVKGKRGNIVEVYPATEYDFVPRELTVISGDHIHFQWTGCDVNPAGNAGEGTDQTDRSNIVQIECIECNQPVTDSWISSNPHKLLFPNKSHRTTMAYLNQESTGNCLSYSQLETKDNGNENTIEQDVQNCMKLNAAPQYFNGGAISMTNLGTYYYMSSRNNNFSNRSQKGIITVSTALPTWGIVLVAIGSAIFVAASAVGAATWYSRSHPHSSVANCIQKLG